MAAVAKKALPQEGAAAGLSTKVYEKELRRLQVELVKLQEWVRASGARVAVIFEGRDGAGKGGTISRITQYLNPRVVRVAALPAPSERGALPMVLPALRRASALGRRDGPL